LPNILVRRDATGKILSRQVITSVLQKHTIVEVEFGHAPSVAKENGDIRSNKRYVDSVQDGNMPKRRLAIVLRATKNMLSGAVVQVVPISSVTPHLGDSTVIEVTSSLSEFLQYQKRSYAICGMVETIPANRIIAPLVQFETGRTGRDRGFKRKLLSGQRPALEAALMHGLDRAYLIDESQKLKQTIADLDIAREENSLLKAELAIFKGNVIYVEAHEAMARVLAAQAKEDFAVYRKEFIDVAALEQS
jgi:uncharacterized protein YifN (PemK superfamily)